MRATNVIENKPPSAPPNGAGTENSEGVAAPGQVQVNPVEVARVGLVFLQRVDFRRHERQAFDQLEAMLGAIVSGELVVGRPG